jgi:hypothetical protein
MSSLSTYWHEVKAFAALGGAGGVMFYAVRWFVEWASGRVDRRQAQLDAEHAALDGGWATYRRMLEERNRVLDARVAALEDLARANAEQLTGMRLAFGLVSDELRKADPANSALRRAEQLLVAAFPLPLVTPGAVATAATVHALDGLPDTPRGLT